MSTTLQSLTQKLANRFEIADGSDLMLTLKNTAFKGNVNDSQMTALLIVANQYGLNPWTKEIYAFPDKNNGIVPIVGVDGWARILNENPQFDGIEFDLDDEKCTCRIYRKDRSKPISVTEYMSECYRNMGPWQTHPKRMLRHKAMIQCARLAFGFTGIYDQDEADRIAENNKEPINVTPKANILEGQAIELISAEQIEEIKQLVEVTSSNMDGLLAACGVKNIESIPKAMTEKVLKKLKDKLNQQQIRDDGIDGEDVPL
ncbi:phage recombination protein Bet [Volucribacter amazonae]|uniref:Recombinase n=1 Tax=Volucribacter amazonae TaxID=256731 RepID=A0A9X4SPS0_9PAST|nr:phage recombination protein Bet [Volucribacter amazonae]MDG6894416.1 recombinase [Volucribacter amazonae]MDG6894565.1 recombinase [Volucribacter amazonae]